MKKYETQPALWRINRLRSNQIKSLRKYNAMLDRELQKLQSELDEVEREHIRLKAELRAIQEPIKKRTNYREDIKSFVFYCVLVFIAIVLGFCLFQAISNHCTINQH